MEVKGQPGGAVGPLSPPDGSWGSNSGVWQEVPLLSEPSHQPNEFVLNEVFVRRIQNYLKILLNIHEKQSLVKSRIRHCQSIELCWCYLSAIFIHYNHIPRGLKRFNYLSLRIYLFLRENSLRHCTSYLPLKLFRQVFLRQLSLNMALLSFQGRRDNRLTELKTSSDKTY